MKQFLGEKKTKRTVEELLERSGRSGCMIGTWDESKEEACNNSERAAHVRRRYQSYEGEKRVRQPSFTRTRNLLDKCAASSDTISYQFLLLIQCNWCHVRCLNKMVLISESCFISHGHFIQATELVPHNPRVTCTT